MTDIKKPDSEKSLETPTVHQIVENFLPDVEWSTPVRGRCKCPGQHKHTSKSHRNDCWVFINGVPTVSCLHHNCEQEIRDVNSKIRTVWSLYQPEVDPKVLAEAKAKAAKRFELQEKAKASLPVILKEYKWDVADIAAEKKNGHVLTFLSCMFKEGDSIWIGEPDTTGREEHRNNFLSRKDWEMLIALHGTDYHFTCASTFKFGTYSRANANVESTPYMVVECDAVFGTKGETAEDKLKNKNASGAIYRWLMEACGIKGRAIVDSGNRSLHFWADMPKPEKFEELKMVLPMLGADKATFKPSQPVRLPGVVRDNGNMQRLLWIK